MSQQNPLETRELKKPVKISTRTPSNMQVKALRYWVENGSSKGEALRQVGYSEAIARQPHKVFDSVAVQGMLQSIIAPEHILGRLKRHVYARASQHITFPPFNDGKAKERAEQDEIEGTDSSEKIRGEQMTDADIRDFIAGQNGTVYRIVHGDQARHVYFYVDNTKASLEAIEKLINLYGLYAPKKTEVKADVQHNFSLTDLRKRMDDRGVDIIRPRIHDQ